MPTTLPRNRHSVLAGNVCKPIPQIKVHDEFSITRNTIVMDETVRDETSYQKADEDDYPPGDESAEDIEDENLPGAKLGNSYERADEIDDFSPFGESHEQVAENLLGAELGDSGIPPDGETLDVSVEKSISVTPIKPVTELRKIFSPHPEKRKFFHVLQCLHFFINLKFLTSFFYCNFLDFFLKC